MSESVTTTMQLPVTPRQVAAYEAYRTAAELLWRVKQRAVTTNEEAKARWHEIQMAQLSYEGACEDLWASVIDALEPLPSSSPEPAEGAKEKP
jgi:hypothetical protein